MDGLLRGILGILLGAGFYSEVYPLLQNNLLKMGSYGKLTLPGLLGVSHWVVIVPLVVGCGALLVWLDRQGL